MLFLYKRLFLLMIPEKLRFQDASESYVVLLEKAADVAKAIKTAALAEFALSCDSNHRALSCNRRSLASESSLHFTLSSALRSFSGNELIPLYAASLRIEQVFPTHVPIAFVNSNGAMA
jgi:hypothetical protein